MNLETDERYDMIREINIRIQELEAERSFLYVSLRSDAKTFDERLDVWEMTTNFLRLSSLPTPHQYPKLRKWIDANHDNLNKNETYDLADYFGDDIYFYRQKGYFKHDICKDVITEAVELNLREFKFYW